MLHKICLYKTPAIICSVMQTARRGVKESEVQGYDIRHMIIIWWYIYNVCGLQWIGRGSYCAYFSVVSLYSKQFPQWLIPEIGKWEQTRYISKHVTTWITWSRTVPQESIHPMAASSSHPHRPFLTVTQCKNFWTLCKKRLAALQHSSYREESTVIRHQKYQMSLM